MKRTELIVWGGALVAASGAAVLLATALTSVPAPLLVRATETLVPDVLLSGQKSVTGVFTSEGTQVPLPPGEWVAMKSVVALTGPRNGDTASPVASTVLLRLHGHRVDAAVLVQVDPPDAASNWGLAPGCLRRDFYFARVRYTSDHDSACSYVSYVTPWAVGAPAVDEAWRLAMQEAVDNGWSVPRRWLAAVYRLTDPIDAMQVRYLFDASRGGKDDDVSADQVARLVAWSETSWRTVQIGFRERLKPNAASGLAEPASIRVAPSQKFTPPSEMSRSDLKTMTFQMLGSLTSFTVAYVYLGSVAAASTLTVAASVASSALSYAHDLAWSYVPDPAAQLHDLPGIGLEEPGPAHL